MFKLYRVVGISALVLGTATSASAISVSFGEIIQNGYTFANGVVATGSIITTGSGSTGGTHGDWGLTDPDLGGTWQGTVFDSANFDGGSDTQATRIEGRRRDIDGGASSNYANAVGFHISFTQAIEFNHFYALDFDSNEWKASFALNGTDLVTANLVAGGAQTVSLNDLTIDAAAWNAGLDLDVGQSAPSSLEIGSIGSGSVGPDDPNGQLLFDYGNQQITDLVFLYGIDTRDNANSFASSGVTALVFEEEAPPRVPLPASGFSLVLGLGGLAAYRRMRT